MRETILRLEVQRDKLPLTGPVVAARVVSDDDDLTIISTGGTVLRTMMDQVKRAGRSTMGVHVVNLKKGDTGAGVAAFPSIEPPADEGEKPS